MSGYKKFFLKRAFWYLLTLIAAFVINFALPRFIPGNPVDVIVTRIVQGMSDTHHIRHIFENFHREFGLDLPLWRQFLLYVQGIFRGDLGTSFSMFPRPVSEIILAALPWTLALQLPAIVIGWLIGNVLGAYAAYKKGVFDKIVFPVALFVSSIPFFIFSILLLYIFAVELGWFPVGGGYAVILMPRMSVEFFLSAIRHHTLPFLSIALIMIGGQGIGMREMALYELNTDYVKYCKTMGLRDSKIMRYVFKNAMLPQITGLALSLGTMMAGALITEIVFNYPGIGSVLFRAIRGLDYPLISGVTLMITITVLLVNFLLEIIYGLVDPRIRAVQLEDD